MHTDRWTEMHTDRNTARQTDGQMDRQTDGHIDTVFKNDSWPKLFEIGSYDLITDGDHLK